MREDRRLDNKSDNEVDRVRTAKINIIGDSNIREDKPSQYRLSNEQLARLKDELKAALSNGDDNE